MQAKGSTINKFVLGEKEVEGKNARFTYDRGSYSIIETVSEEEQNVIYKSRNSQEAYTRWNVYIGRKRSVHQEIRTQINRMNKNKLPAEVCRQLMELCIPDQILEKPFPNTSLVLETEIKAFR